MKKIGKIIYAVPFAIFGLFHFISGPAMTGIVLSYIPFPIYLGLYNRIGVDCGFGFYHYRNQNTFGYRASSGSFRNFCRFGTSSRRGCRQSGFYYGSSEGCFSFRSFSSNCRNCKRLIYITKNKRVE